MSWYNESWKYRIKITVQNSKVDADLTDFPVYVNLANLGTSFWSHVLNGGADIRVTRSDGTTECAREIVSCNTADSTGEIHFKANSLLNATDVDFYIYYGNSGASDYVVTDTYGRNAVWSNGYKGVWHLNESSGGTNAIIDSSGNSNHATDHNSPTFGATGKLGKGITLSGASSQYLNVVKNSTINNLAAFTYEAWVNPSSVPSTETSKIFHKGNANDFSHKWFGYGKPASDANAFAGFWSLSSVKRAYSYPNYIYTSTWYYLVETCVSVSDVIKIYRNAVEPTYGIQGAGSGSNIDESGYDLYIGAGYSGGFNSYLSGTLDELRLSNVARTATWISTQYNNQSSPSTFYNVGVEEGKLKTWNDVTKSNIKTFNGLAVSSIKTINGLSF